MSDIINGFQVTTQKPLDETIVVKSINSINTLGTSNNKAFRYYNNMIVKCLDTNNEYCWREGLEGEIGLLEENFTYPIGSVCWGYDYSNKSFNFYLVPKRLELESTSLVITNNDGKKQIERTQTLSNSLIVTKPTNTTERIEKPELVSDSLIITVTEGQERIEVPQSNSIPTIIINNSYLPSYDDWLSANALDNEGEPIVDYYFKGYGTSAKPYTDSIKYTLSDRNAVPTITSNTAIQNGTDAYIGTGTRLNPQQLGKAIIIQNNNNVGYVYNGDFSFTGLNLFVEVSITSTIAGKIIDMDNATHFSSSNAVNTFAFISFSKNTFIYTQGLGIFNSGNSVATDTYATNKCIYLNGEEGGIINQQAYNGNYILNGGIDLPNNNNAGNIAISVQCIITSFYNGVYNIGGRTRLEGINATLTSGNLTTNVSPTIQAFRQVGGWVRLFNCTKVALGIVVTTNRESCVVFESSTSDPLKVPVYLSRNTEYRGTALTFFSRLGTKANVDIQNCNTVYFGATSLFDIIDGDPVWKVLFKNNVFENTTLGTVDIVIDNTVGSINIIGNNVIESLPQYPNRTSAASAGIPVYGKFINTNSDNVSHATWFIDIVMP